MSVMRLNCPKQLSTTECNNCVPDTATGGRGAGNVLGRTPASCADAYRRHSLQLRMLVPGLLLLVILGLFSQTLQDGLRNALRRRGALVFAGPLLLWLVFCLASWRTGAWSALLGALAFAYTLAPTACVYRFGNRGDLAAILLLWLPLEFAAGATLVPRAAQGYLHTVAYGIAIVMALWLFLIFLELKGMKYNLPRSARDGTNVLAGFAIAGPVLIGVGLWLGFLAPLHAPRFAWPKLATRYVTIVAATALPEEILFRGLIQNRLVQRFGSTEWTLLAAALIFGAAHLNNGPQLLPNWRYFILATIAGYTFGKVFQKSSSILASASLHGLINTVKYAFF